MCVSCELKSFTRLSSLKLSSTKSNNYISWDSMYSSFFYFCFPEQIEDACYGGYVDINCEDKRIYITEETYGRHPLEKCAPSIDGSDCSVAGEFYKKLCHGKTRCQHLGVGWRLLNEAPCIEVYTNYVHIVYQCVSDPREYSFSNL